MIARVLSLDGEQAEQIVKLGRKFYAHVGLGSQFHEKTFVEMWNALMRLGVAAMWVAGNPIIGSLGAILSPGIFDGVVTVQECFWFVDPEHRKLSGLKLFGAMERWAVEVGAKRILMAHVDQVDDESSVAKFYVRSGFRKLETVYVRE